MFTKQTWLKVMTLISSILLAQPALAKTVCVSRQELTARSLGIVQKYYVSSGDSVKKGDLIVELDARLLRAGLKEAQGAAEAAKANEDLAQDALMRLEKLKGSESVTEQQLVEARVRTAQARAMARQAQGALDRVKVQLEDSLLRAEIAGTVQGLPTILGLAVQPGQSLGRVEAKPGTCVATPEIQKNN